MNQQLLAVKLSEFKKINEESYQKGYNRTLYYDIFLKDFKREMKSESSLKWRGEDENFVMLKFAMFHEWKKCVRCDTHIRALVLNGVGNFCGLYIDLDIETWVRLEMNYENVVLNEALNKRAKEVA